MTQILYIHGGMTFKDKGDYLSYLKERPITLDRKRWSGVWLEKELGENYQLIKPTMPLRENAHYDEWKINFERYFYYLQDELILIGSSLGGIFLAKYLSENKFPKKIKAVFLICPPYDDTLTGEDLVGGFELKSDLSGLENSTNNLYLLFSADDNVVPVSHAMKYKNKLNKAHIIIYNNKNGHFKVEEFPEIVELIKKLQS